MNNSWKKIFYVNTVVFLLVATVAFTVGFFVIKSTDNARAQEEAEDKDPPTVYNIKVTETTATSTVITWETNEEADSLLNYGLSSDYGVIRDPRPDKVEHKIVLNELLPDTKYYFRVTSADLKGNQGISSDFSFITEEVEVMDKPDENPAFAEEVIEEGEGGLSEKGLEEILQSMESLTVEEMLEVIEEQIEKITSEETLETIQEMIQNKAEEVIQPPTIILDYADVEVGTDWAIITWQTDKESNTVVALAADSEYNEGAEDPYRWREGQPDEMVLEHQVEITGLKPATEYHFQVSSESDLGLTGKSQDKVFKTKSIMPEISNVQVIKIQEDSATLRWTTNIPCSAIIDYTNLTNNETKLEGNSAFVTSHSMMLTNLIFDTYYSAVIKVESEEGEKAESEAVTFITIKDEEPPVVVKVNTESTIYPGSDNKIQTIASWQTDEPAQCQLFYHQGLVTVEDPLTLPKEEDYGTKHVQVVTNFLPSTVYKFWIICNDEAENVSRSQDFTMLTPSQEESIIDIIIKNFESSFGWVKKMGG